MPIVNVGTREISGVDCEIRASSDGRWSIYVAQSEGEDDNPRALASGEKFDNVVAEARKELKKRQRPISIRFWTADNEEGEATGVHARNRSILATVGGVRQQLGFRTAALRYDTPPEVRERLLAIRDESNALHRERAAIVDEYTLDLSKAVDAALNAEEVAT